MVCALTVRGFRLANNSSWALTWWERGTRSYEIEGRDFNKLRVRFFVPLYK